MPYLYQEDEAHHFNRLAEIAKSGDLNPHYFHKPSLHFYLRLPAFYATFAAERYVGRMQSLDEIITRDRFGLAGYSFSVSHPWFLLTSRITSLCFTLATLLLLLPLSKFLRFTNSAAFFSALTFAVLPPFVTYAGTVGVDTPMALFCLACSVYSVRLLNRPSAFNLVVAALLAGAAVSTKYNALPIIAVPLLSLILSGERLASRYVLAIILPVIGFFACSPFILVELPKFWEQLSYEVWHYRVAGHVGNQEEPGIAQAIFYLSWFWNSATGPTLLILGALGIPVLLRSRAGLLLLTFPALYFIEMSLQRANFTRNMLVFLPYIAISAGSLLSYLQRRAVNSWFYVIFIVATGLVVKDLAPRILIERYNLVRPDSRIDAARAIKGDLKSEIAVAGELQFEPSVFAAKNIYRIRLGDSTPLRIYAAGFDRAVVGSDFLVSDNFKTLTFSGMLAPDPAANQRVVRDPTVRIIELADISTQLKESIIRSPLNSVSFQNDGTSDCVGAASEGRCWLTSRSTQIMVPKGRGIKLLLESPWENTVEVHDGKKVETISLAPNNPVSIKLPKSTSPIIFVQRLFTPQKLGINSDDRRLGVAIIKASVF
jgi:hypothetical protein